jgi:hypothetical protein
VASKVARHVIDTHFDSSFLGVMVSRDVASNMCQTLGDGAGGGARGCQQPVYAAAPEGGRARGGGGGREGARGGKRGGGGGGEEALHVTSFTTCQTRAWHIIHHVSCPSRTELSAIRLGGICA